MAAFSGKNGIYKGKGLDLKNKTLLSTPPPLPSVEDAA